jgi:hypothetical protein
MPLSVCVVRVRVRVHVDVHVCARARVRVCRPHESVYGISLWKHFFSKACLNISTYFIKWKLKVFTRSQKRYGERPYATWSDTRHKSPSSGGLNGL